MQDFVEFHDAEDGLDCPVVGPDVGVVVNPSEVATGEVVLPEPRRLDADTLVGVIVLTRRRTDDLEWRWNATAMTWQREDPDAT